MLNCGGTSCFCRNLVSGEPLPRVRPSEPVGVRCPGLCRWSFDFPSSFQLRLCPGTQESGRELVSLFYKMPLRFPCSSEDHVFVTSVHTHSPVVHHILHPLFSGVRVSGDPQHSYQSSAPTPLYCPNLLLNQPRFTSKANTCCSVPRIFST